MILNFFGVPRGASSVIRFGSAFAICLFVCVGCGTQTYNDRLQETVKYFEFRELQDQVLVKQPWQSSGISLRIPKFLTQVPYDPPPAAAEGEEVEVVEDVDDPRQPDYCDLKMAGMVAAWTGTVDVEIGKETEERPCYFYVLSNYELWLEKNASEVAIKYYVDLKESLEEGLHRTIEDAEWDEERHPPNKEGYVEMKEFTTLTLSHDELIHGVHMDFTLYLHQVQDMQVAILTVLPHQLESRSTVPDAIARCLETLVVSGEKPVKGVPIRREGAADF